MKLTEEIRIAAPREAVFAALNDADVLRRAIPGCEELEKVSDTELSAVVRAKVGPVRARFRGDVTLSDLNPPESYTLKGQGKGGAAGFARGEASVRLTEDGDGTLLHYDVNASVGGKLAQLGSRLVNNSARALAGEFFENFRKIVSGEGEDADADKEVS